MIRKEENEEVLPKKAYVTDKYQIVMMGGGNFEVRIMGYTSDTYVSYDSDKKTWTTWSSILPDKRIESKSITGLWLNTWQLRLLLEAFTNAGIQELINSEITFVNEE